MSIFSQMYSRHCKLYMPNSELCSSLYICLSETSLSQWWWWCWAQSCPTLCSTMDCFEARPFSLVWTTQMGRSGPRPVWPSQACPSPANCRQASRRTPSPRPAASPPRIRGWVDATQPVPESALGKGACVQQPYPPPVLNHGSVRM